MKDKELMLLIDKDPGKGMNILMKKYTGVVCATVKGKFSGEFGAEDVEECISDVFCDFYKKRSKYDPSEASIKAFLCVMAKRAAEDYARKHKNKKLGVLSENSDSDAELLFAKLSSEDEATLKEQLLIEVDSLDPLCREVIIRRYFLLQSNKEISKAMGCSVPAVDKKTQSAIKELGEKLGGFLE